MKLLLAAALLACLALAHGRPSMTKDEKRELITLLKKVVMEEMTKKQVASGDGSGDGSGAFAGNPYDALETLREQLEEQFPDDLNVPTFRVKLEVLGRVFSHITHTLAENIPEGAGPLVAARFTQSFTDFVVYEGMCKLYQMADQFYFAIYDMTSSGTSGAMPMKRSDVLSQKSKNFDRLDKALKKLSKGKRSLRKMEEETEEKRYMSGDFSGDFSGFYIPHFYDVVYERLIAPGDNFLYEIYSLISEHDPYYYGSFFYELQYMAEDDGLLSRSLRDTAGEFAHVLARYMFEPPYDGVLPGPEIMTALADKLNEYAAGVDYLNDLTNFADVPLEGDEKAAFLELVSTLAPMAAELKAPLQQLAGALSTGEGLADFFLGVAAHVLSEQFETLNNVINIVRAGAEKKREVIQRLTDAMANGRGEEVFVALFVKMAHGALASGYRIEEFMYFAGMLLDQVDADINGPVGSGDMFPLDKGFRGHFGGNSGVSGASGASGAMKRFLKMKKSKVL